MVSMGKWAIRFGPVLLAFLLTVTGAAAEKAVSSPKEKGLPAPAEMTYDDPLGRSTPRGTVKGFLNAMQQENEELAVEYLDTRQKGRRAQELAVQLNHILYEGISVSAATLSPTPEGDLRDDLPANRDSVGIVTTKTGNYRILLERVKKENNPPIWLFSSETLKLVPQIYEEVGTPWIEQHLPAVMTDTRISGIPLYRWVLALLLFPLVFLLARLFTALIFSLVREPLHHRLGESVIATLGKIRNPVVLLFFAGAVYILSIGSPSLTSRLFWTFVASTMAAVGLTWITLDLIDAGAVIVERRRPEATNAVIRLMATLLKALTVIIGLVVIFYYFAGINLTAVVTGLGVGGIAVAFAAQKTIENFFGGVFLVWDRPIRLGDFCKVGDDMGTVEDIGLRSTRIRTLRRTVLSIPNGQLSAMSIENFALRDRFLFKHMLNLRYETTADQLRYVLAGIRELLYRHPRVDSASARIRFVTFGASSLDLEIFSYVTESSYDTFLAVQEDLLLRVMDLVEESGSGFAFPSRTVYMAKDGGLDTQKSLEARECVRRWREQDELPFPDHRPVRVSQLEGTLDYPPDGSVLREKIKIEDE